MGAGFPSHRRFYGPRPITCRAPYLVLMLLTALTPPLFPQGVARAVAEAKEQPLAPRRALPPARTPKKASQKSKKAVKESKVSY